MVTASFPKAIAKQGLKPSAEHLIGKVILYTETEEEREEGFLPMGIRGIIIKGQKNLLRNYTSLMKNYRRLITNKIKVIARGYSGYAAARATYVLS